jgi:hypothetical protein
MRVFLAYRSSLRSCRSTRDERCQPSPIYRQLPAGSLHRALADERRALMILQRTGNDLCGRGRTAVDEDDDRFALGEVASRYRHPRYARSDQKRARPKDSSESGGLRSRLRRYRSTRRSITPVRWWIYVTSGAGRDFGRMAASAAFLISSNRPPLLIKHWQMLNGVVENFQFSRRQNLTCRHHAQVAEEPNAEFVTWRVFLRPLSPIRSCGADRQRRTGVESLAAQMRELQRWTSHLSKKCRYARSKKNGRSVSRCERRRIAHPLPEGAPQRLALRLFARSGVV